MLCHWRPTHSPNFKFPTIISDNNMTYKLGVAVLPFNVESQMTYHNTHSKSNHLLLRFEKCKTMNCRLQKSTLASCFDTGTKISLSVKIWNLVWRLQWILYKILFMRCAMMLFCAGVTTLESEYSLLPSPTVPLLESPGLILPRTDFSCHYVVTAQSDNLFQT
jgi:hypothetical protein